MAEAHPNATADGPVRGAFWALLAVALLLALALPLASLYRAASSALDAHACVWPPIPHLGAPAQLLVVLPEAADRAAMRDPWARLEAEWDMVAMRMGARRATVSGPSLADHAAGSFAVPLHLDMAGAWTARISLSIPGRPAWETTLGFTVLARQTPTLDARASPAISPAVCGAPSGVWEGGSAR